MSVKRLYKNGKPVIDYLIIHHTAGNLNTNRNAEGGNGLKASLSRIGWGKGYEPWDYDPETGECWKWRCATCRQANSENTEICTKCGKVKNVEKLFLWGKNYLRDPVTKEITYSEYHYVVHPYTKDGNIHGWRMVQLVNEPLFYDCGSTGKIKYNQKGIALVFCGNYEKKYIDTKALQVAALGLRWLWEYTEGNLKIPGHNDIDTGSKCPGMIKKQLHAFRHMISGGDIPSPRP